MCRLKRHQQQFFFPYSECPLKSLFDTEHDIHSQKVTSHLFERELREECAQTFAGGLCLFCFLNSEAVQCIPRKQGDD